MKTYLSINSHNFIQSTEELVISKYEYTNPFTTERNTNKRRKYQLNIAKKKKKEREKKN